MEIEQAVLAAAATIFAFMNLMYLVAWRARNAGLVDAGWGLGFVLVALVLLIRSDVVNPAVVVVYCLIHLWGLRLVSHLSKRNLSKPEDWRYQKLRKQWGRGYAWRSYLQIFMLQGVLMLVISASTIVAFSAGVEIEPELWLLWAGVTVWLVGFYFEVVADLQLARFIARRKTGKSKQKVMTQGLWRYSRHPNYFGEVAQWWGIWLVVASLPYGLFALISPLTITWLILFVSGVPLLEQKYAKNPAYRRYAKKTSRFVPMPPRT